MAKNIPTISAIILDFDQLLQSNDANIFGRFQFYCSNAKKRIFPKSVIVNAYRVDRSPSQITIILLDASDKSNPKTTARYIFLPPPDFSRRYVST
jgi:hypothetical protein